MSCLELFSLDRPQCVKDQLDDAVVLEGRQRDHFTAAAMMIQKAGCWRKSIVLGLCFQLRDTLFNATKASKGFSVSFLHIDVQHLQL